MDKNSWSVNLIRIEFTWLDDNLRFGHGDLAASCCVGVEVARSAAIDKVTVQVGLPGLHQGYVGPNATFKDVRDSVEVFMLLAFCNHRTDAGSRIKTGN